MSLNGVMNHLSQCSTYASCNCLIITVCHCRLKKEQVEAKDQTNTSVEKSLPETEELSVALKAAPKKATPGTLVGEEKVGPHS